MADSLDAVEGLKVTLTVQEAAAAKVPPTAGHVLFEIAKSEALLPLMVIPGEVMVSEPLLMLPKVTVRGELVVLIT